jgi:hypothetical protein
MSDQVIKWYVLRRNFKGEASSAIYHTDHQPGEKSPSGSPTGIFYSTKIAEDHHELSLRELDNLYAPRGDYV